MAQLIIPVTLGAEEQIWRFMTEQSKNEDRLQSPQPLTDFYGEDRHELGAPSFERLPFPEPVHR